MKQRLDNTMKALEAAKSHTKQGIEYWTARKLQAIMGYSRWENFTKAIQRASMACESTGNAIVDHFLETTKMVRIGSGSMVEQKDLFLTRYACYLIAMNGDSNKSEIATAQTYFAIQSRRQELQDQLTAGERRLELRDRVTDRYKSVNEIAQQAGVQNFGRFQGAGYRGLYKMGLAEIKKTKGLPPNANLLDHAGKTELAANEFRLTQTEEKIIREEIQGEQNAINAHLKVGEKIRSTIKELGGTMPENLKPEPSIKKLEGVLNETRKALVGEKAI